MKFIDERDKKLYDERQEKIRTFINELKDRGFISNEYILGRRMIGGTPEEYDTEFDILLSDEDEKEEKLKDVKNQSKGYIERFIKSLEK